MSSSHDFQSLKEKFLAACSQVIDRDSLEQVRVQFLGKKGVLAGLYDHLKSVEGEAKKNLGQQIHGLRQFWEEKIEELAGKQKKKQVEELVESAKFFDVSLPVGEAEARGSLHPVSLIRVEILKVFRSMGFAVWDGPEVDFDRYNFGSLNFPDEHPARDMQDTFFVGDMAEKNRFKNPHLKCTDTRHDESKATS